MTQESTPQPSPDIIDRIPTQEELVAERQAFEAQMPDDPNHALRPEQVALLRERAGVVRRVEQVVIPNPVEVTPPQSQPKAFEQPFRPEPENERTQTAEQMRALREQIAREDGEQ